MKRLYLFVFFVLSVTVMWDILGPGYIFTIDMVFGPYSARELFQYHILGIGPNLGNTDTTHIATIFYTLAVYLLDIIFPSLVVQKLLFLLPLTLAGIAMYRLVPGGNTLGKYFAGILYMINPFIYVRVLSGSTIFLLAYALLPFAVKSFLDLLQKPTLRNTVLAGLWLVLLGTAEHFLFLALGIFCLLYIFKLFQEKQKSRLTAVFFGALAVFSIINAGWIYAIFSGEAEIVRATRQMSLSDLQIFATAKGANVFLNVITLYGFWRSGYYDPRFHLPGWQIIFGLILFLAVLGLVYGFRGRYGLSVRVLGLAAIVALFLSVGVSSPLTSGLYRFLYENVPLFAGMRESQKFAALLVLAYAYLGSIGIAYVASWLANLSSKLKILRVFLAGLILVLPLIYTYPMLFGVRGQLGITDYPQDYHQVDDLLNQDEDEFSVLFLPWHNFMEFSWAGGNIVNPANVFFTRPIVQGDNIEIGELYTQSANPVSRYIEAMLEKKREISNMGEFLAPLGVKYVILAKEVNWGEYQFLEQQTDLTLVMDTAHLRLFINRSYAAVSLPIGGKAESLGLTAEISEELERKLALYGKAWVPWVGYVTSFLLFSACLGYVLRKAG